jgi:MbtH protein
MSKIHSGDDDEENAPYDVVTDIEERYSIWPQHSEVPKYWKKEGFSGTKKECLDYIQNVWTDMRPLSLKKEMAKWEDEIKKRKPSEEKLAKLAEEREEAMAEGIDHFHSKIYRSKQFCVIFLI